MLNIHENLKNPSSKLEFFENWKSLLINLGVLHEKPIEVQIDKNKAELVIGDNSNIDSQSFLNEVQTKWLGTSLGRNQKTPDFILTEYWTRQGMNYCSIKPLADVSAFGFRAAFILNLDIEKARLRTTLIDLVNLNSQSFSANHQVNEHSHIDLKFIPRDGINTFFMGADVSTSDRELALRLSSALAFRSIESNLTFNFDASLAKIKIIDIGSPKFNTMRSDCSQLLDIGTISFGSYALQPLKVA